LCGRQRVPRNSSAGSEAQISKAAHQDLNKF